jgi:hypothetical protein
MLIFNFFNNNSFGSFVGNKVFDFKDFIISKNKINLNLFYLKFIFVIFNFNIKLLNLNFIFGLNFLKSNNYILKNLINKLFFNYSKYLNINTLISNLTYLNFFEIGLKFNKSQVMNFNNSFILFYNIDNEIFLKNLIDNNLNIFLVYIGSFFDISAKVSNLIFPINLFFEYNGLFLNFEGKLRKLVKVINNNIYNSKDLFKSLFIFMSLKIKKNILILKIFFKILKYFKKFLINWDFSIDYSRIDLFLLKNKFYFFYSNYKQIENKLIDSFIYNYYKTDVITKNSKNLTLASIDFINNLNILD